MTRKGTPGLAGLLVLGLASGTGSVQAAHEALWPNRAWSFQGPTGTFDRAGLQRGFQVYREVCAACHSLSRIRYRDLAALGYTPAQIKHLAAQDRVVDAHRDAQGMPVERPALPQDALHAPFPSDEAARQANQGALPPDLSLIIKARKGGPDYLHALLTGYTPPPAGFAVQDGLHYNTAFPGHQVAMAPPLTDGQVMYTDGTQATVSQMAEDVATFLTWASEPAMEQRKQTGLQVMMYTGVLTLLLLGVMRRLRRRLFPACFPPPQNKGSCS